VVSGGYYVFGCHVTLHIRTSYILSIPVCATLVEPNACEGCDIPCQGEEMEGRLVSVVLCVNFSWLLITQLVHFGSRWVHLMWDGGCTYVHCVRCQCLCNVRWNQCR